ncbi:hypothetical protein C7974DRAFT_414335 [Boeremia exigua]|uniref:uncharacterized protein n=1 Tax=Boeremia exigua TaxID=749465 RepID=UPI001E8D0089|nr:uncharacterized protein C7974DRAFT_414335 [Boeremia exigua]KAH6625853.1 hypothetical protein C7974DRAFT_414335 [Boeremia exigua]
MSQPIPINSGTVVPQYDDIPLGVPHLLMVPGEIRNRIYVLAVADVLNKGTMPGLAHPKREARTTREAQLLTRNWRLYRRSCLGLTQVCRQLRNEFLPIYRARIPISVRITELEAYICVFVMPQKVGNIRMEIDDGDQTTELRDAVILCASTPRIRITYGWATIQMIRLVHRPEEHGRFYMFLSECVKQLVVVPKAWRVATRWNGMSKIVVLERLEVYVKTDLEEQWMKALVEDLDVSHLSKWRLDLGLPVDVNVVPRVGQYNQPTTEVYGIE